MRIAFTFVFFVLITSGCKIYPEMGTLPQNELISIDSELSTDRKMDSIIAPYKVELEKSMSEVIAQAEVTMFKKRPEGLLGNAVADVVFKQLNDQSNIRCDFVLLNHGGLRAPIGKGDITIGGIFEVMPFDNQVAIVSMKGKLVKKVLKLTIEKGGDPISNATIRVTEKDTIIRLGGILLDENKTYRMATSDYMANGGDSYSMLSEGVIEITTLLLRDVIMEGVRNSKRLDSQLDGRIQLL